MPRSNMQSVILLQYKISVRDIDRISPLHRTDQDVHLELAVDLGKRQSRQRTPRLQNVFHQLHSALHKCLHLTCLGKQQDSGNLIGRR